MKGPIGVVVAMATEAGCMAGRRCRAGERLWLRGQILVQVAGIGAQRARRAGEDLLADGAGALLSFGVAAGIAPGLASGTLLLPDEVIATDGRRLATDAVWRRRWSAPAAVLMPRHEPLAEASAVLTDSGAKRALAARTGAVAADMESAAVLSVAAAAGVPALVVRCVLDPLMRTLPSVALAAVRADGSTAPMALAMAIARHPRDLLALPGLAIDKRRALSMLARFADATLDVPFAADADDAAQQSGQNCRTRTADRGNCTS